MKDQLRKSIINSLIPNLQLDKNSSLGLYPLPNKITPCVYYFLLDFVTELGIRYLIGDSDIIKETIKLLQPETPSDPNNWTEYTKHKYKLYFFEINNNVGDKLSLKNTINFYSIADPSHSGHELLRLYPEVFEGINKLLDKCKPIDVIRFSSDTRPNPFGYMLYPSQKLEFSRTKYFLINIDKLTRGLKNTFRSISKSIILFIEKEENIKIRTIRVGFSFCLINNDKVYCFTTYTLRDTFYYVLGDERENRTIIIFLEPIELAPENKREANNLFLLWSALMAENR